MDAAEIIHQHLEARGGLDAIMAVQSLHQVGQVHMSNGLEVAIQGWRKRPDFFRVQHTAKGMTGHEGWDGQRAWEYYPWRDDVPHYVEGAPADALRSGAEFDGPLVNWETKGHRLGRVEEATEEGRDCYLVYATLHNERETCYHIDAETLLIHKETGLRTMHGKPGFHVAVIFEDYRHVGDVIYPFKWTEVVEEDGSTEAFSWLSLEIDVPFEAGFFEMPPLEMLMQSGDRTG